MKFLVIDIMKQEPDQLEELKKKCEEKRITTKRMPCTDMAAASWKMTCGQILVSDCYVYTCDDSKQIRVQPKFSLDKLIELQ